MLTWVIGTYQSSLFKCYKGLVTNYGKGGYKTGGVGHVKLYPYEKGGGAEQVSAMLKGGGGVHNKFWGSFYAEA